jgi:hypothetical protein
MIGYGQPIPGFSYGEEVDNGDGTISVRKPNGKYLCVTPLGVVEERDTPGGLWESFIVSRNALIAKRDNSPNGWAIYVLPRVEA